MTIESGDGAPSRAADVQGHPSRAALVTGCSTGIGRATAIALARAGVPTWASARDLDSIADLRAEGCHTVRLDVTDELSRRIAVEQVSAAHGAVGILVNNAGVGEIGPLELITERQLRSQFETNVFGLVQLTQLVLPGMRARRSGSIVNVGSVFGQVSLPGQGAYCMTKHALEAFTEALRLEVRPFGVQVTLVAPQQVDTDFIGGGDELPEPPADTLYGPLRRRVRHGADVIFGPLPTATLDPERVARVVVQAATERRPQRRYPVGLLSRTMPVLRQLVPERIWEGVVSAVFAAGDSGDHDGRRAGL
jgi:NAD(P)-dependent dehydrogenase (short-subunit alcohol dehydrogenase family)